MAASPAVREAVAAAEVELGRTGRVLLRPSGTEQLVRVMVEAPTQAHGRRTPRSGWPRSVAQRAPELLRVPPRSARRMRDDGRVSPGRAARYPSCCAPTRARSPSCCAEAATAAVSPWRRERRCCDARRPGAGRARPAGHRRRPCGRELTELLRPCSTPPCRGAATSTSTLRAPVRRRARPVSEPCERPLQRGAPAGCDASPRSATGSADWPADVAAGLVRRARVVLRADRLTLRAAARCCAPPSDAADAGCAAGTGAASGIGARWVTWRRCSRRVRRDRRGPRVERWVAGSRARGGRDARATSTALAPPSAARDAAAGYRREPN